MAGGALENLEFVASYRYSVCRGLHHELLLGAANHTTHHTQAP